ncbi:hypothetical protein [Nostoc sp.]|uniref:hypothetical protein n=1 Tax=Nostoc sp. TaxID=1180 RepID=UPI002FF895A6
MTLRTVANAALMVVAVLTLLWRDVTVINEITIMLTKEGFLWYQFQVIIQACKGIKHFPILVAF